MSARGARRFRSGRLSRLSVAVLQLEMLEERRLLAASAWGGPARSEFVLDPGRFDAQSVLVRFRDGNCASQVPDVLRQSALTAVETTQAGFGLVPGLCRLALPAPLTVETAIEQLRGVDSVLYAEPVYQIQISATPDDPRFDEQWGLHNEGQSEGTVDADIDAPEAWDATVGSGQTIVAVIDTGVDYRHVDLAANMWVNAGEVPNDGVDNDGNGFIDDIHGYDFANHDGDPLDDHKHGTHVAGTIAAIGNNGIGVTGINWNAKIMALKFLNAEGSGDTDDAILALNYAVANGAKISNNSWGFSGGFSQALYDSIKAARNADHVFVAAAGNGNFIGIGLNNDTTPFWPASFDLENIVSVAAVDRNDAKAVFSNFGATTVDLAAPGVDILSTVRNNAYGLSSGTSMASPHVAGVVALVRDLHPDWDYSQVVHHVLASVDPVSSMQGITTTGGRLNAAAAVGVNVVPSPDIQVSLDAKRIPDNTGIVDYGSTPPGLPVDFTYTVTNRGVLALHLDDPVSVPSGYRLVSGLGTDVLNVGASTTFTVRLEAAAEGSYSGQVSFSSDDPDENPYNFTVTGTVAPQPAIQIIDNGDSRFRSVGEWKLWTNQGFQGDVHESYAGTGADTAHWVFDRLLPGQYRVAATWAEYTNRATNAPFSLLDGNVLLANVNVNQRLKPTGFSDQGQTWQYLGGPYSVTNHRLEVKLSDAADGRLNADAIRIEFIEPVPEIEVLAGEQNITDDTGTFDVGTAIVGGPLTYTFTVRNRGGAPLILSQPTVTADGFTVASGFGTTTLATDQSTTFAVRLDAADIGSYSGTISFGSNDADEALFNFTVQGTVVDRPAVQISDNGDPSFQTVGEWTLWTGQGFDNDIHESYAGTGADVAKWTFTNLQPGSYRVAATWREYTNRATNSPFTIFNGSIPLTTLFVNQKLAPSGFSDAAAQWQYLGGAQPITGDTLVVQLSDAANGRVNADAIRIERLEPTPEIEIALGSTSLLDGASMVDFGGTTMGVPVARTFTITNRGGGPLQLQEPISVPGGFRVISGFGTTSLGVDQSTSFAVQLDPATPGVFSGTMSIVSDDADENPFEILVQGEVLPPPAKMIMDNGDAGFTTTGEWTRWTGQGYLNDVHESKPGTGADVARWTFTNLLSGLYRVSATWSAYTNRATNSPFEVLDGDVRRGIYAVNQRVAPTQFLDEGGWWYDLGVSHQVESGTLAVRLSDAADGRVNADAIRIERLAASAGATMVSSVGMQPLDASLLRATASAMVGLSDTARRGGSDKHHAFDPPSRGVWETSDPPRSARPLPDPALLAPHTFPHDRLLADWPAVEEQLSTELNALIDDIGMS